MDKINKGFIELFGWISILFLSIGVFVFGIFVSKWLINWHIAPYFGLHPVTAWQVLGLSCVIASFKSIVVIQAAQKIIKQDVASMSFAFERVMTVFITASFILALGWIAK